MNDHEHNHDEEYEHSHGHTHPHKQRKQVTNRLARIEGHVRSIKEMSDNGRDCPDILLQIAAVKKALDGVAKVILKDHLEHCVVSSVQDEHRNQVLSDLQKALDNYIR
ncbi:metal-sensing transcriptional repressor [Paenibacillus andongensis]|uniref:metal-sensing transcriptional repressor n=1 Tax=Paenibacillus andongensis TaxID=2975482 RepID=UPI0021BBB364|nr:metal-sensing transcriptional repressor [Paenibacillus andongensis]